MKIIIIINKNKINKKIINKVDFLIIYIKVFQKLKKYFLMKKMKYNLIDKIHI